MSEILSKRSTSLMSYPVEFDGRDRLARPYVIGQRLDPEADWKIIEDAGVELVTVVKFKHLAKHHRPTHVPFEAKPVNCAPIDRSASFLRFCLITGRGEVLATPFRNETGHAEWVFSPDVSGLLQNDFFTLPDDLFQRLYEPVPVEPTIEKKVERKPERKTEQPIPEFSIPNMIGKLSAESCAFAHIDTAQASLLLAVRMLPENEELHQLQQKLMEVRDRIGQSVQASAKAFGVKFEIVPY